MPVTSKMMVKYWNEEDKEILLNFSSLLDCQNVLGYFSTPIRGWWIMRSCLITGEHL